MLICIIQAQCSRIQRSEPDETNKEAGQGAQKPAEGGKGSKPDTIFISNFEKYAGELSPKEFLNIFKKVMKF